MAYSDLCPSKYLLTADHFDKVQWCTSKDVPLTLGASMAGGLILASKERQMWYESPEGDDVSLWMIRFYVRGDATPFFWFSKNGDKIGDLEIQHLNSNLIKRIGEIKWKQIEWNTLKG